MWVYVMEELHYVLTEAGQTAWWEWKSPRLDGRRGATAAQRRSALLAVQIAEPPTREIPSWARLASFRPRWRRSRRRILLSAKPKAQRR